MFICGNKKDKKLFKKAEETLTAQGHAVINPIRVIYALPDDLNDAEYLTIAFELIKLCDAICLMDGWENDLAARLEAARAGDLKTILP